MKLILTAVLMLGFMAPALAATPRSYICTAEVEADREPFVLDLHIDHDPFYGAITFGERGYGQQMIISQEINGSTIIMDRQTGTMIMAFVSDTMQGWFPYEAGSALGISCRPIDT